MNGTVKFMKHKNYIFRLSKRVYICIIAFLLIVCGYRDWKTALVCGGILAFLVYYEIVSERNRKNEILKDLEGIIIKEKKSSIAIDIPVPIVAVEVDGSIVWKNKKFQSILDSFYIFATKIQNISHDLNPNDFLCNKDLQQKNVVISNKNYLVSREFKKVNKAISEDGFVIIYYFLEQTELLEIKTKYEDEKFVVGILNIDCYEDLILSIDDERRQEMLLELEKTIQNWLLPTGGIARKVERDKYILMLYSKWLREIEKEDFKILEDVKEIKMGNTIPLTVSIGFGSDKDTYIENFNLAKASLDIALGRGGDQVVLKDNENTYFYGGNTIQAEKTTKVKARVVAYALKDLIESSENVLIMGHKNCDMDALGAGLGVWSICRNLGKQANIVLNNSNVNINNMISRLSKKEIFGNAFVNSQEALERIEPETLLVVVDTNKQSLTECEDLLKYTDKIVVIDHHRRGTEYIKDTVLTYLETYVSSASEMVTEIIQYLNLDDKLDELEAQGLYTGILVDTKNFLLKTGIRTFEACALLRKYNIDTISIKTLLQNDLKTYTSMSNVVNMVELIDGKIAISKCDITTKDAQLVAAKAADQLLNIEEIDASFVLSCIDDAIYISGMSLGTINVQMILERLGGGGSFSNAGARIVGENIESITEKLKQEIHEYLGKKKN